jgi:large conductance mechanosensitive channel
MNGIKKFFKEFKEFISRGNIVDMAVGIIIGSAFTAIVTALTDHILRPVINWIVWLITGGNSDADIYTYLHKVVDETTGLVDLDASIYIDWGAFISAIVNFILIALVLFLILRAINNAAKARERAKADIHDSDRREKIAEYRKQGLSLKKAEERYEADLQKAIDEAAAKKAAEEAAKPTTEQLLAEIRDLLANK